MTMKIEELYPPTPIPPFYPCEAKLKSYDGLSPEYRARRARSLNQPPEKVKLCGRRSAYRIGGKCYCRTHAGHVALSYLMEQD